MSILTQPASQFPIPCSCKYPPCVGKLHKHGKRDRHVIELKKVWYSVQRFRCSVCGKTFTLLQPNMLPFKHYAASEIEQVLQKHEDPSAVEPVCDAEESTIYRWKRDFPAILTELAARLASLAKTTKEALFSKACPLQGVYNVLKLLVHPPSDSSRLAWAYFWDASHPVCIG
jgi:transposase-like protein